MSKKNLKYVVVGIIIASAVGYLVYGATKNAGLYYFTVSELINRGKVINKTLRVNGKVVNGSIKWYFKKMASNKERIYEFIITDGKNNLSVRYEGSLPDTFRPDEEVMVEGGYEKGGIFEAKKVMGKCPSKYETVNGK